MAESRPYLIINFILAGVIAFIFIYSGIFSAQKDNHPLPSFFEEATGQPAPSSGMSRAFSEIIRGDIPSARQYNADAPLVFAFFLIQLFQRLGISLILIKTAGKTGNKTRTNPEYIIRIIPKKNHLIYADVLTSIILFLYCFGGQIRGLIQLL